MVLPVRANNGPDRTLVREAIISVRTRSIRTGCRLGRLYCIAGQPPIILDTLRGLPIITTPTMWTQQQTETMSAMRFISIRLQVLVR